MQPRTIALAALLAAVPLAGAAQSPGSESEPMDIVQGIAPMQKVREARFRFLDRDGDGNVTREEIGDDNAILLSQFTTLDADSDGRLSEAEYLRSHGARIE